MPCKSCIFARVRSDWSSRLDHPTWRKRSLPILTLIGLHQASHKQTYHGLDANDQKRRDQWQRAGHPGDQGHVSRGAVIAEAPGIGARRVGVRSEVLVGVMRMGVGV